MAPLTDPDLLARYREAMSNYTTEGYVEFEEDARRGLREVLEGWAQKRFKQALYEFVIDQCGEIDQVAERRERWRDVWEFHYDLRLTLDDKRLYVETRLRYNVFAPDDEPIIYIVNIHLA